jgi:hypothetical protein
MSFDEEYIKEFINIVYEENEKKTEELTYETEIKLKSNIIKDNLLKILYNLDDIDIKLSDISFRTKYNIYNLIFSKEMYNNIKEKTCTIKNYDITKDEFNKYLIYCGIICESVKNSLYNNMIKRLEETQNNNNLVDNLVYNAIKESFVEIYNNNILFIQELYDDAKRYYYKDEIYNEILHLIENTDLLVNIIKI